MSYLNYFQDIKAFLDHVWSLKSLEEPFFKIIDTFSTNYEKTAFLKEKYHDKKINNSTFFFLTFNNFQSFFLLLFLLLLLFSSKTKEAKPS